MIERQELACEALAAKGNHGKATALPKGMSLVRHDVEGDGAKGKGIYLTLKLPPEKAWDEDVERGIARALRQLSEANDIQRGKTLVAGLGNHNLLCDRLGWDVVDRLSPDANLMAFCPMVKEQTGMDTADTVKAVAKAADADLVVAVDSLVCRDPTYLLRTVELSDAGLTPGGGVGLPQKGLDRKTVGVPLLYLGVPTLSYVNPYVSTLCVTVQDMQKQEIVIAEAIANALMSAWK